MKNLHEVIADTQTTITEITSEGKKLWKVITSTGEELIGELGYKVFNPDWRCRRMQYTVGEKFEEDVRPSLCDRGLHYCPQAADCFNYYDFNPDNKVALVLAYGVIDKGDDKHCTDKIFIVREIPWSELLEIANEGKRNTGLRNAGAFNTGDRNTGNSNTGNRNTGNRNTGNSNAGNSNTGDSNTGHRNTGDSNFGNRCTGDFNIADDSTGVFCTEKQTIKIFDVDSGMTLNQWHSTEAARLLDKIPSAISTEWMYSWEMSDEEKKAHPDYENMNGYLKVTRNEGRFIDWWKHLSEYEKQIIKEIPGFDAAKFKLITGIDVYDPNNHIDPYHHRTRFRIGDKVTIREDLNMSDDVPFGLNSEMVTYAGKTATITDMEDECESDKWVRYRIDLDGDHWSWSSMMFEGCGFCK